jgi:hypothetical protein
MVHADVKATLPPYSHVIPQTQRGAMVQVGGFQSFNNRKNRFFFRDTVLTLIGSPNLEYKNLTANEQSAA